MYIRIDCPLSQGHYELSSDADTFETLAVYDPFQPVNRDAGYDRPYGENLLNACMDVATECFPIKFTSDKLK